MASRAEYTRAYVARKKAEDRDAFLAHRARLNKDWIAKNRSRYNAAKAEYRYRLKLAAIEYYSRGTMACAHCGYDADLDALCLDHINDDGAEHRRELGCSSRNGPSGTTIYERLKAKGWMEGLQVLCFNCNTIKELRRKRGGRTSAEMREAIKQPTRWKDDAQDPAAQ